ncbi:TetR/AcrR family transcriptional regulator [Aquibium carbonis]|uniref:TetR/AcrR family transcriptional regulator n=1 Tax=Aquibium carbonis TaxID=2495581 RepID=A0A429Z165_9HYPH|nr:TetR/AcrR family transcriptional regulator [Aquibium carbonis]RST87451.1 TetR/AcrR family transcriptional regulator [Aquibium carbonis]
MVDQDTARASTEDRQKAIADAARVLIAERGFEGLRTRDIADRVGINIATLHYHVPTKQALIRLVAQSLREDFQAQHARRPRQGLDARSRLELEFADFRELFETDRQLLVVMAELGARARRDAEVAAEIVPLHATWNGQIAALLAEGRDDGSFHADIDPAALATIVIGAMTACLRHPVRAPDHLDAVFAQLRRAIIRT